MGGDIFLVLFDSTHFVSIHAPAWGATSTSANHVANMAFQSTPPHGGRLRALYASSSVDSFNPRPRMGGDAQNRKVFASDWVSIHAPAWGATDVVDGAAQAPDVSIHAPAWGATLLPSAGCLPIAAQCVSTPIAGDRT